MGTTPQKLADWLQDKTIYLWDSGDEQYYASPICEDIVPMLRQQQAEIEALKGEVAQLKHMNKNWQISENILLLELEKLQSRELTDSEIRTIQDMCHLKNVGYNNFIMRFARAILRKAQEK